MKIAFFDSGIGGITVLKQAIDAVPNADFIYYADSKNVPYGTKNKQAVYQLISDALAFIAPMKPDVVVLACNTATSIAAMASLTLAEEKLEKLISTLNIADRVEKTDLDGLVTFAERFDFASEAVVAYLQEKFSSVQAKDYDSIVLGCTHFIFYKNIIQDIVGSDIKVIDGNGGTVNHLVKTLGYTYQEPDRATEVCFFSSGEKVFGERKQKLHELLI